MDPQRYSESRACPPLAVYPLHTYHVCTILIAPSKKSVGERPYKALRPPSPPYIETTMNLKSLAALTLAASAAPLAVAGPLAYALCQTGVFLPTIIRLRTHDIIRLQLACSRVLRCCRFHLRGDPPCSAPRHHQVQCGPGNLHGSVCCCDTPCPNPLSSLLVSIVCPRCIQLTAFIEASPLDVISICN